MAQRTTVSMITAGPDGAVYGIYRAHVRNPATRWTWHLNRAQLIATVRAGRDATRPSYRAMAEQHATPAWPALDYPDAR